MKNLITTGLLVAFLLIFFSVQNIQAQGNVYGLIYDFDAAQEYFIEIDPYTADYTVLDTLEEVQAILLSSSTFNHIDHEYIFTGLDQSGTSRLYTINALDGSVLSDPVADDSPVSNLIEFEYDLKFDQVFALRYENGMEYFVQVDLATSNINVVAELPEVDAVVLNTSTFDSNQGHYIFIGVDNNNVKRLYTINAANGEVISNPEVTGTALNLELQFDNTTGNLFGLYRGNIETDSTGIISADDLQLVSIDQSTASFYAVGSYPDVNGVVLGGSTYIQDSSHFMFRGADVNNDFRVYVIDVTDGSVVADNISDNNYIELQCDNSFFAEKFYEKGEESTENEPILIGLSGTDKLDIYPNPVNDLLNFNFYNFSNPDEESIVQIIDDSGRTRIVTPVAPKPGSPINVEGLKSGVYIIRVITGTKVSITKFVKL